jgi:predicted ATPase
VLLAAVAQPAGPATATPPDPRLTAVAEAAAAHNGILLADPAGGVAAVFADATAALITALLVARAYAQAGEPPRLALHSGPLQARQNMLIGATPRRAAALLAAAHPGQILLSQATADLVRQTLPPNVTLRDRGERRLKDLQGRERVAQLVVPGQPADFPPLWTVDLHPNNLSPQLYPLMGREAEEAEATRLLLAAGTRLLTLTGPAGVGKTRLAVQVAAGLLRAFPDGVYYVSFSTVDDPALVLPRIAEVLGAKESGGRSVYANLRAAVAGKTMLLLLDNLAQVADDSVWADDLLALCPDLRVLATSRGPLHRPGEQVLDVPPLALPNLIHLPSAAELARYDAVALFVARAQESAPGFALTTQNAAAVAQICVRLDGLPLAIELAAARSKQFAPPLLLDLLTDQGGSALGVLTSGAVHLPERPRTMRSAIGWSYALLDPAEQQVFSHLAVFVGGCTVEAAAAVLGPDGATVDLPARLHSLREKSLLRVETPPSGSDPPRYLMLSTIRAYAEEQLAATGQEAAARRRHADFFAALAEQAEPELHGPAQVRWMATLECEHGNLRAALRWALAAGETDLLFRLVGACWRFWFYHSYLSEGRRWTAAALARLPGPSPVLQAHVILGAGTLAYAQNDYPQAIAYLEQARDLYAAAGHREGQARAINTLGTTRIEQGDYAQARALFRESLALQHAIGDKRGAAMSLLNLGNVALNTDQPAAALKFYEASVALLRQLGDRQGLAICLHQMGEVALDIGDPARAHRLLGESLTLFREAGNKSGIASALHNLVWSELQQGAIPSATTRSLEAVQLAAEIGDRRLLALCLEGLGVALGMCRQGERAVRLWGAAAALRASIAAPMTPGEQREYAAGIAPVQAVLDPAAWDRAWAAGRAMSLDRVLAEAEHGAAAILAPGD